MKLQSKLRLLSLTAGTSLAALIIAGCQSAPVSQSSTSPAITTPALLSAGDAKPAAAPAKGGAQLWAETCNRCHNIRSPDSYGPRECGIAMTHMRVRGYLTGEDQRAIQKFLQSQ